MDTITLAEYHGTWEPGGPDATFRREMATYCAIDPMPTLEGMSESLDIPVGAIARYILVKWATSGSEGLMEIGPRVIRQMAGVVQKAEAAGTTEARVQAYEELSSIISWLAIPLDDQRWRPGGRQK